MYKPDFLLFNKKERGIIILLFIVVIFFYAFIFFIEPNQSKPKQTDLSEILIYRNTHPDSISQVKQTVNKLKKKSSLFKKKSYNKNKYKSKGQYSNSKTEIVFQKFDPNKIDSLTWISLGFSKFSVSTTLNYRAKGGFFKSCDALYKIYGMDSSHVNKLIPYCNIDPSSMPTTFVKNKYKPKGPRTIVDINTADTTQLKTLKGIGSKYAATIVKYRDIIGGFKDIQELSKVYGIEQEVIDNNIDFLTCSPSSNLININTATPKELNKLYAINYKQSQIIVNYRKQHGPFSNIEDLKLTKVVSDSMYTKMLPYITLGK